MHTCAQHPHPSSHSTRQDGAVGVAVHHGAARCYTALLAAGHPFLAPRTGPQDLLRAAAVGGSAAVLRGVMARCTPTVPSLTTLHLAAAAGDGDGAAVRAQLAGATASAADMNAFADGLGMQPLHVAAAAGSGPAVEALVAAGALPATRDRLGRSVLHIAAAFDNAPAVRALVAAGAELEAMHHGDTPLGTAATCGAIAAMVALLEAGANVNPRPKGGVGRAPLLCAASGGSPEAVRLLLSAGADVHAKSESFTALHAACGGHGSDAVNIVRVLLAAGAKPVGKSDGLTPLGHAVSSGNIAVVEALLEAGADLAAECRPLMHCAVQSGNTEMVALLVRLGVPVDALEDGRTALWNRLSMWGFQEADAMTVALVTAGASLAFRDEQGATPLHVAAMMAFPPHVALLLAHGADAAAEDSLGRRPFGRAREAWHKATAHPTIHSPYASRPDPRVATGAWECMCLLAPAAAWARRRAAVVGCEL